MMVNCFADDKNSREKGKRKNVCVFKSANCTALKGPYLWLRKLNLPATYFRFYLTLIIAAIIFGLQGWLGTNYSATFSVVCLYNLAHCPSRVSCDDACRIDKLVKAPSAVICKRALRTVSVIKPVMSSSPPFSGWCIQIRHSLSQKFHAHTSTLFRCFWAFKEVPFLGETG